MRSQVKHARILRNRSSATAVVMVVALVATVVSILTDHTARGQEAGAVVGEVRIAAQRQEDGVVRFGLRAPDGSGGWTQPVRPRAHRFDPATTSTGRWLVSSPLILELDDAGRGRLVRSDRFEPSPSGPLDLVSGVEGWAGDARYSAYHDEQGDLVTEVSIYSVSVGAPDGELRTSITCRDGEASVRISGLPGNLGDGATSQQIPLSWHVDHGTRHTERWPMFSAATGPELVQEAESRLAQALLGYGSQLALTLGGTANLMTAIDLDDLRALPVYPNLRHCGGDIMPSGHAELRIRAQVRADERIEFAVQQRTADGWSDNILPRARTIAAFGDATNWLSSTPVSVRVQLETQQDVILPTLVLRQIPEPITPVLRSGYRTDSLVYGVYSEDHEGYDPTKLTTIVAVTPEQGTQLQIACLGDERRVILAGALFEATGDLTLSFDDTQLIAKWDLTLSDNLASLSPVDSDRIIQRLRQAQTLSVSFGGGGYDPRTYDLTDLFETRVQANIDQCGNYAEPQWRPVTSSVFEEDEHGDYYSISYPDGGDPQRHSQVRVAATEGTPAAGAARLNLVMSCDAGDVSFGIWGLPAVEQPDSIRLRIDDGMWFVEGIGVFFNPDGTASIEFRSDLARFRQGRELSFEYGSEEPTRGRFDLTNLLGTPIQTNFDNCGREYWPVARTYVPVVGLQERSSRYLRHTARRNNDGTVTTYVSLAALNVPEGDAPSLLEFHCIDSSAFQGVLVVRSVVEAEEVEVSLTVDHRPTETATWIVTSSATNSFLHPPSNAELMSMLRSASVAIVEVAGINPGQLRFQLSGLFNTPVQGNLDECGYYRPGAERTLPLPLNASGTTQTYDEERDLTVVGLWERVPGRAMPSVTTLQVHHGAAPTRIGLAIICSDHGARLFIFGRVVRSLTGDQVQVEWSTDGSPARRETWNVTGITGPTNVSPNRARALIAAWRDASELELSLFGPSRTDHRFDLDAIFGMPAIDTFDACLAAPLPSQAPPVTGIPTTVRGEIRFTADFLSGSSWLTTYVSVRDNGDAPTGADDPDNRSSLFVACGAGGLEIWVTSLNRAQPAFIAGDSVDVNSQIDGRARTESWVAWTQSRRYSIAPTDRPAFYAALKDARTLTIQVQSDPPITKTYELASHGFWDTPVQPNLDGCGEP